MAEISLKLLVQGGKASSGQAMAQALAPKGIDLKAVVAKINEKTKEMEGMEVPVEIVADTDTKAFEIKVGTPSVSAMIKKEIKAEKLAKAAFGTYTPKEGEEIVEFHGDITMDQIVKITKLKKEQLGTNFKHCVKQVVGSCVSNGCTVEGKHPKEIQTEIDEGKWDEKIKE